MSTFIARKSNHIQEDIQRNWSSWNFGQEGFEGDIEELKSLLTSALENEASAWISGFDIWVESVNVDYANKTVFANDFEFRELHKNYWVAVDNVNAKDGLSGIYLDSENIENAIKEAEARTDYFGDGDSFDATTANLVFSKEEIHIFEIK